MENMTILLLMLFSSVIEIHFREGTDRLHAILSAEVTSHEFHNMADSTSIGNAIEMPVFPFLISGGFVA
jgi:hypothetical protein